MAKAVAILTNGSTWNLCDREMRKAFMEQDIIVLRQQLSEAKAALRHVRGDHT